MSALMGVWALTNLLLILPLIFSDFNSNPEIINLIATWNVIGSALVPSIFILFIDGFEGGYEFKKIAVASATVGASIFIAISGLIASLTFGGTEGISLSSTIIVVDGLTTMRWSNLTSVVIFPTVLLTGYWIQKDLATSKKHALDPRQLRQIMFMRIGGFLSFFIGPIFGVMGVVIVESDISNADVIGTYASEIIGYTIVSTGVAIFSLAYATSKEIAFLQPQRIDSILVIYETGIPIFSHEFRSDKETKGEFVLISGALTAITALMSEAFDVSSNVKEIHFQDKQLLLQFNKVEGSDEVIAFILISDRTTAYLKDAVWRFGKGFTDKYQNSLSKLMGISEEDKVDATSEVRVAFGLEA